MSRWFFNRVVSRVLMLIMVVSCASLSVLAQEITKADFDRLNTLPNNNKLVYNGEVIPNWVDGSNFWYSTNTKDSGLKFILVDCKRGAKSELFDRESLATQISTQMNGAKVDYQDLRFGDVKVDLNGGNISFNYKGESWSYTMKSGEVSKLSSTKESEGQKKDGAANPNSKSGRRAPKGADGSAAKDGVLSPNGLWEVYVKDRNVYLYDVEAKQETQLSSDGAEGDGFMGRQIHWSSDSKQFVAMRVKDGANRRIPLLESAPSSQLQPILQWRNYLKPGDSVAIRLPYLYDVESRSEVVFDREPFKNQYNLKFTDWRANDRGFTFEFNQRGHQLYQLVEVSRSGECRVVVEESFPESFIHYGRLFCHHIESGKEIIWISERDGWRHLYLFDAYSGAIKQQITSGDWVVREVVEVDDKRREILFYGSGRNSGEDPYNMHLYRVGFDGKNLVDLTPENGNHKLSFSDDKRYVVDVYSRPDMAPISLLRRLSDGKVIRELESADISELLATGWTMPEVFVAKGRDGETDIWGNIHRPSNFSPDKTYPIIEYIYAGPHSSHVNKNFLAYTYTCSRLAELGFIVVSIDGMGTSNRSKAFHDVCWRNLKDGGYPDRILWIKAAAEKYPYMDTSNVGVYGYSAGGQNAMSALLFFGDFYKTAVSICGCHDNRMDKIWWNEQWMGYPIGDWYDASSSAVNAHLLKGKLLLMNGELDDNVDPASTLQVVDALVKANKEFEMVYFPGKGHALAGAYELRKVADFFVRNMMYQTINWNE